MSEAEAEFLQAVTDLEDAYGSASARPRVVPGGTAITSEQCCMFTPTFPRPVARYPDPSLTGRSGQDGERLHTPRRTPIQRPGKNSVAGNTFLALERSRS